MVILILLGDVITRVVLTPLAAAAGYAWIAEFPVGLALFILVLALPGRWMAFPVAYHIRASTKIDASLADVWHEIAPRNRDNYWSAMITHTTLDPDDPTRIDYHFEMTEGIATTSVLQGSIVAEELQKYYAYRPLNGDEFPLFSGDVVLSEYILTEVDGGTEVTFVERLARLRFVAIPMLFWMNPCRDALIRLKATCEGVEDTSWMGKSADNLRQGEADRTISTYSLFKWVALAFIPIAFTLAMISVIGHLTAP